MATLQGVMPILRDFAMTPIDAKLLPEYGDYLAAERPDARRSINAPAYKTPRHPNDWESVAGQMRSDDKSWLEWNYTRQGPLPPQPYHDAVRLVCGEIGKGDIHKLSLEMEAHAR